MSVTSAQVANVVQLDWSSVCRTKGVEWKRKEFCRASGDAFVFHFSLYWLARSPCIVVEFSHV